ncbi:MAG: RsmD family RNA methyltransferase [Clostridiales bacterium]|jgi:16S rRNA (guanine(966)-N(2))-methyltransferase RsmD|nr:RsmD family RNA methyltransferase [Clostridiales bacterium]
MRVIAGLYKGRALFSPAQTDRLVRPTSDRAKEGLFNVLQWSLREVSFLDLFCGSGAIGIEALSRGAHVTFVDDAQPSLDLTRANLKKLGAAAEVVKSDALAFLRGTSLRFGYIFLDPPYNTEGIGSVLRLAAARADTVIYEHTAKSAPRIPDGCVVTDTRRYGLNGFTFLKAEEEL